jgi:plastocyanin
VSVGGGSLNFAPDDVTIQAGDTVQWDWDPSVPAAHSVTAGAPGVPSGLFDSTTHTPPFTFSYTFQTPGTYQYYCKPHFSMGMTGVVRVTAATSSPTALANISTRLPVQTGDNALIGGFIVTGTQPKKIIIRAIGPSLSLPGKLANPILELFSGSTLLESNDNWVESPNKQAIIDSTIPPSNDLESAIVRMLPANSASYTAVVRGVNNTTGIGVVEAYDLDQTVDSKLANISTRGLVQTDPNVLIAGTIVIGQNAQKVIVRAIGPSLSLAGKLADPNLELRDSNGTLLQANDNWKDSANKQAIIDSTVPPSHDLESAIVATLPSNGASYTAIVRGAQGASGIAVVEVYALQ